MKYLYPILFVIFMTSCALECIDKKTGLQKSSQTITESKQNKVFLFEMYSSKEIVHLDSSRTFQVVNSWVEKNWHYDCINNKAVLKIDSAYQFIIDAKYNGKFLHTEYYLMKKDTTFGNGLNSQLCFDYNSEDTISLLVAQQDTTNWKFKTIKELKFVKRVLKRHTVNLKTD